MDFRKVSEGQTLNFAKDFAKPVNGVVSFNLNWGKINGRSVDLDACLVMESRGRVVGTETVQPKKTGLAAFFDWLKRFFGGGTQRAVEMHSNTQQPELVYFQNLRAEGVVHHGDDLTGAWAEGEFIEVNLQRIPRNVDTLTFGVLSFSGHDFAQLPFADIKVFEGSPKYPTNGLVDYSLRDFKRGTMYVAMVQMTKKADGSWDFKAINKTNTSKSTRDIVPFTRGI